MTAPRPPASAPSAVFATAAFAAGATWVTFLSWSSLSEGFSEVAFPLLVIALTTVGLGTIGRWRGWPYHLVLVAQVVVAALFVLAPTAGSLIPTPGNLETWWLAVEAAAESARAYPAPVPLNVPPVHPLLLLAGAASLVIADLLVALNRAPLVGFVLLVAYSTPPTITGHGVSWWLFVAAAALYLCLVYVQHADRVSRWGHHTDSVDRTSDVTNSAFGMGAVAMIVALFAPLAVPSLDLTPFRGGAGPGTGPVEVKNPIVDLRRDLSRGIDVPLMTLETTGQRPSYLRLSVLTRFVDGRWTPGDREIPQDQSAVGEMPGIEGAALGLNRQESRYQVDINNNFESPWLPTAALTSEVNAGEEWRYDISTRDFMGIGDATTAGISYDFTGVTLDYDPEAMADSVSGASAVRPIFTEVPASLNNEIRRLAASVTADAPTRFEKAQALQQWFRQDGGFRYDLAQADSLGSGHADLNAFLLDEVNGRVGYCEQFAASMAIMARTLGIPARVAVGFLEPREISRGGNQRGNRDATTWEYSAWDMHAWPELYFPGAGWVRFEPTPGARAGQTPGYTTADIEAEQPELAPTATGTTEDLPERTDAAAPEETDTDETSTVRSWWWVAGPIGAVVIALIAGFGPRALRRRQRRNRLRSGVEGVWRELQATVIDLAHRWPTGRSPRRIGREIAHWLANPHSDGNAAVTTRLRRGPEEAPAAAAALERLVKAVEQHRYSRAGFGADHDALVADLHLVEESLAAGASSRVRRRAAWLPHSLTASGLSRPRPREAGQVTESESSDVDELVG